MTELVVFKPRTVLFGTLAATRVPAEYHVSSLVYSDGTNRLREKGVCEKEKVNYSKTNFCILDSLYGLCYVALSYITDSLKISHKISPIKAPI